MLKFSKILKSAARIILVVISILLTLCVIYLFWHPGTCINDGRYDLGKNAIWLQHGWLGDDTWFKQNRRNTSLFRNIENIRKLKEQLSAYNILYVYPHLCPADKTGKIPDVDARQVKMFLEEMYGFKVMPWIGGVLDGGCFPDKKEWRENFINSIMNLLNQYPLLAGVHINIEPMPSGNKGFVELLKEIKNSLPEGKILSVAAYPPPTIWHNFPEVHWDNAYYNEVTVYADQIAVMMYDTAITNPKLYQWLMGAWVGDIVSWTVKSKVLFGLPAYDDAYADYHNPKVENLKNAIFGINAGLAKFKSLPSCYEGLAIYCEWEMNTDKWNILNDNFSCTLMGKMNDNKTIP